MTDSPLRFRIQPVPTVIMVLLAPMFIALGLWQLDRADQKRALAHNLEQRRKLPPLLLSGNLPAAEQLEYRSVTATGRLLNDKTVLIENRKYQGNTGFHVITPLRLSDSNQIVLVNRGWISRQQATDPASIARAEGEQTIRGEAVIPQPPALNLSLAIEPEEALPHWPFLTLEHYSAWSGLSVLPFMILQAPDDISGFVRRWPEPRINEGMHIGYAIQWFAFALIALVIWLRLSLHRTEQNRC
ncbi:MAG: SURF1 family protein [Chromatiales bacterium]|jgi:surfeit locus 1 family protein